MSTKKERIGQTAKSQMLTRGQFETNSKDLPHVCHTVIPTLKMGVYQTTLSF